MNLALFDLDNTLLSADTDVEWVGFLIEQGALPPGAQEANAAMDRRYASGEVEALEYVRFYLSFYPSHDMARLLGWRSEFLRTKIAPRIAPGARRLLESHRKDLVAIITATNRFLSEPIANLLDVQNVIATEPQIVNGRFTGEVLGRPCMREGKIQRLDEWLALSSRRLGEFVETWFYSDSINDLPLLERVTHPVAVDAGDRLKEIARSRGWRTLTLR